MKWFKELISEGTGASTMRICVMLIVIAYMFNWTWFNLVNHQLVSFDFKDLIGLLGCLVIKLGQKKFEGVKKE